jgi:predicted NUDIX family phosphoesterase
MTLEKNLNPKQEHQKTDEIILVVKREKLIEETWQGIKDINFEEFAAVVEKEAEFMPRSLMEQDPKYKQIIPYLIFNYQDKLYIMQRQAKASEQRLKSKLTLGIGGHIRKEDLTSNNIIDWATREFEEEVDYKGGYKVQPIGLLNDDSNPVGEVHLGVVFLLIADSDKIEVRSEFKSGKLITLEEGEFEYPLMENWAQICFDFIKANKII